jgi:hypothetical protein
MIETTNLIDQYCDICEQYVFALPHPVSDPDGLVFISERGANFISIGDLYNAEENLGLWNDGDGGYPKFVCMNCITTAYEHVHGEPLRKRLRYWLQNRGWQYKKHRRRAQRWWWRQKKRV